MSLIVCKTTLLTTTLIAASVAIASEQRAPQDEKQKDAIMAVVRRFADIFGTDGAKAAQETCTTDAVVVDDLPPHLWKGADSCAHWVDDIGKFFRSNGMTGGHANISKPLRVTVSNDQAYVVAPIAFEFNRGGNHVSTQPRTILTLVMHRTGTEWKVATWVISSP